MSKKDEEVISNSELLAITSALEQLSVMDIPCKWALSKNLHKAKKRRESYLNLIESIRDKYVKPTTDNVIGYKLNKETQEKYEKSTNKKKFSVRHIDFDAGDKQKEYEEKLKEAGEADCNMVFSTVNMSRMVVHEGKDVVLGELMDTHYKIPFALIADLVDIIFIEE